MTTPAKPGAAISGGIGAFFYASIVWVLAIGALVWVGVISGVVEFHHHLIVAERMDNRVGVKEPLRNPVKLLISNQQGCIAVTRAFADGDTVTMYLHNACHEQASYYKWGWTAQSPDGTVVSSKWDNTLDPLDSDGDIEKTMTLPDDSRVSTIKVWANRH